MKRTTERTVFSRCYLCGKEEPLEYVEFAEYVCPKDKVRIDKFLSKLRTRRTRYHSVEAFVNAHKL